MATREGFALRSAVALWAFLLGLVAFGPACSSARADNLKPRVIVFVHGLHGDKDTWRAANGAYWPDMVRTDPHFSHSDVVVGEYPSPSMRGRYSTTQLAEILYQGLKKQHVWDHREVVIIAHSLGGLVTEQMLLNHPADANRVVFLVSYATPHQGSFVASIAKVYDSDPLLTDLRNGDDNNFLMDLEQRWRSAPSAARIHRYCAYEGLDTASGAGIGQYLRARTRVVTYYSATYGCDVDTPAQKIMTDHIDIVKPANRNADAYTFFAKVYKQNPIIDVVDSVRDNKLTGLNVPCNKENAGTDLQVPIALNPAQHELITGAEAEFVDTDKIRDVTGPAVTRIDAQGIAHVAYSFKGVGRGLGVFGCPTGHASVLVHFHIRSQVPIVE
jgi:pimeloyl-ACP methyl ester carboxylesterase